MNWYYADGGQQAGPVDEAQFEALIQSGRIRSETLVWREGMSNWLPLREVRPGTTPPPGFPPVGLPGTTMSVAAGPLEYAGFWIRFGAKMIDGLILTAILAIPAIPLFVGMGASIVSAGQNGGFNNPMLALGTAGFKLFFLISNLVTLAYNTFFLVKYGATPGKLVCQIKVISATGGPLTVGRALARSASEILSRLICYLGYIIAAFDTEKRALHDHIAATRVIKK